MYNNEEVLKEIIESPYFHEFLEKTNHHFFNLKQEHIIRNFLLKKFNESDSVKNKRAFAEFPRKGQSRVDLGIISTNTKEEYLIELKYHFPKDLVKNEYLVNTINKNIYKRVINKKKIDLLIIIICEWDKGDYIELLSDFNINTNLNNYQLKNNSVWRENMIKHWQNNLTISYDIIQHEINKPIRAKYDFYLIKSSK